MSTIYIVTATHEGHPTRVLYHGRDPEAARQAVRNHGLPPTWRVVVDWLE